MSLAKSLIDIAFRLTKNMVKLALGRPAATVSLGSMTLDKDDIILAKKWIEQPENWYRVDEAEEYNLEFAKWNGSKYAFSFMGGRVALSACIYALGLQPQDEVILPGYTCVVVPNAFHYAGIRIVYSDIELDTYGLDASKIEEKITPKTRAILLHHLYGLVCRDYEAIIDLAKTYNLKVIEDCAHATGAIYRGKKVGNLGDVAFYSSEQSKVFNTIQGGMAVTNNDEIASRLKEFHTNAPYPDKVWIDKQLHSVVLNYFQFKHPQRWLLGDIYKLLLRDKIMVSTTAEEEAGIRPRHYGCKMPAAIASLGINQLKKIDLYNELRRENAKRWDQWCEGNTYQKPMVVNGSTPIYLRYPVLVEPEKKRNSSWASRQLGISLGVWFTSNTHPVKATIDGCPNADKAVNQCVNFPTLGDVWQK